MKKLGFGLMRLPLSDPNDYNSIDHERFCRMADDYLADGFTYFDTAYPYHGGHSEGAFRRAVVERHPREAFTVTDKMPTWAVNTPEDYPRFFAEQLERCGVRYFDYYWLHTLDRINYANSVKLGGFAYLQKLKKEGLARHIGFSFHDNAAMLDRILTEHPEMEYVQLQINYADWEDESIESRKCYEVACKHDTPIIVMEPVKGGALANVPPTAEALFKAAQPDKSVASWAVRYAASLPNVLTVLSGMSTEQQLADNMSYMKDFVPLDEAEKAVIAQAMEIIRGSAAIGCTACRYCTDGCPQHIAIPDYFSLYNKQHQFGLVPQYESYYERLGETFGKASACIACGQCERHCPQHIAIMEQLKNVAAVFEKTAQA